ncbi:MAG: prepilin-type N-terminal cleavage/methylation domain-containing protein [Planctomycetota bacterium]
MRGFTLAELVVSLSLVGMGALVVSESLVRAGGATGFRTAHSEAAIAGDRLLRRLSVELSQSSAQVDRSLPPDQSRRLWILPNGIRFQRVTGIEVEAGREPVQHWSPAITYSWNPADGKVTRTVAGQPPRVVATGVVRFEPGVTAAGQVAVLVETAAGDTGGDVAARHRELLRITPRNPLR